MGQFLEDVLGPESARILVAIVNSACEQKKIGYHITPKLPLRYVDMDSCLPTKVKRERVLVCDKALREVFGVSILDDKDPIPDTRTIRLSPLFYAHNSDYTWLRHVPFRRRANEPNASTQQWMQGVASALARRDTRHFLYRFQATPQNVAINFRRQVRTLSYALGVALDDVSVPFMVASPLRILRRPAASACGFDALAAALVPDKEYCVKVLPTLNFLHAGTLDHTDPNVWVSPDGTARLQLMMKNFSLLSRMQGVHIWCCPSYQRHGIPLQDHEEESGPLRSLDDSNGRQAVYEPLLLDFQADIPAENDPAFEHWIKNFKTLIDFIWKY